MVHLPSILLLGCLVQEATALAQVATSPSEHLAVHGPGRRTALQYGRSLIAAAEVSGLGEVGLDSNQNPQVIISVGDNVVFGGLMLVTPNPHIFARDSAAQRAAQVGIEEVAGALNLSVREIGVSLVWSENYPRAVRVDFDVAFRTARGRQAFTKHVATGGARTLVDSMCGRMPRPYKNRCTLPSVSLLERDGGRSPLSLAVSDLDEATAVAVPAGPQCFGTISINPEGPPQLLLEDPHWQEALAMAIAEVAWVSRLQVGALMAVVANSLRLDFWLTPGKGTCSEAAMKRVTMARGLIASRATSHMSDWSWDSRLHSEFPVYGRMLLHVPSPRRFAGNKSVLEAVERALAQVAAAPGPEALQLPARNVSVSLATVGNVSDAVKVGFRVAFNTPRDRQVFSWDFAADGGQKLANSINTQLAAVCEGHCRLPGEGLGQATPAPSTYAELGKRFGTLGPCVPAPADRFAKDPMVHEAMAMATSEMVSMDNKQVGVLVFASTYCVLTTNLWLASSSAGLREAAVTRLEKAGRSKFIHCTLAQLDRLHSRKGPDLARGSITLHVPRVRDFTNSAAGRNALRSAIAQVAAVPSKQVRHLEVKAGLWEGSPQLVRVDFQVAVDPHGQGENFTRAIAGDGGEKLVMVLNELVPKPFNGQCQLPVLDQTEAQKTWANVNATAGNYTTGLRLGNATSRRAGGEKLRPERTQQYGNMLVYVLAAEEYLHEKFQEAAATTIAEVASVPRSQVGIMVTAKSRALLSIDFWVADSSLREAALRRVNTIWTNSDLKLLWRRVGHIFSPIFMVSGGTVSMGLERYQCEQ